MLPRRNPTHRPRLESGVELRDAGDPAARAVDADAGADERLLPEEEQRRRAYAEWLARFERGPAAA